MGEVNAAEAWVLMHPSLYLVVPHKR